MTDRYVGIGGNDGSSGLTWALRKLTLNGAEDTPVVAGDTVYVGPGVYRELLTVDVSGGGGTEIIYIADVTGENTDDVGGIVRLTGSDNDQTAARVNCISANAKDYRIFRGFEFDITSGTLATLTNCDNWTVEDCSISSALGVYSIEVLSTSTNITIRRCFFYAFGRYAIRYQNATTHDNAGHLVENCLFGTGRIRNIQTESVGGITVRNCTFIGGNAIRIHVALTAGQTVTVNNCIFQDCASALAAQAVGEIIENYNTFYNNSTDRTNVNVGANSVTYPGLFQFPTLFSGVSQVSGFKFPWWFGELSEWSQIAAITGSNEPTEDLRGIVRPTTAAKNSWGATQFFDAERETGTVRTDSVSITLHDAGSHQIWVPVTNESTTISVYVYREANYAGTNPRLVVKQPGQADDTTTDAAAASQWNQLTTTLTPAADPPYVVVELQSLNTAAAGNYDIFFDDLTVS